MEAFRLKFPDSAQKLASLAKFSAADVKLEIGSGFLKAGTHLPERGTSAYARREVTLILEGELTTTAGGQTCRLVAGDIVTIPPGEKQRTVVNKDTRLIWMFFGS